jgi:thermosome
MMGNPNQPVFILREGTERIKGKPAMSANIRACEAVAEAVRTTLGPSGMDKMLVQGSSGETVITNDGATILREIDIEHPAAKLIIEVSKVQEQECYDGTTSAVVITGALLKKAEEDLLAQQIHPTMVARGYRLALEMVQEAIHGSNHHIGVGHNPEDRDELKQVAKTALTGKSAESAAEVLSSICVDAIDAVKEGDNIDLDHIKVLSFDGDTSQESRLEHGVVIEKEAIHSEMTPNMTDASVLLITSALEIKETKFDAQLSITDPTQIDDFLAQEENALKEIAHSIGVHGVNTVICQKEIDDLCAHYLAKLGITALKRVKKSDMDALARLTGAKFVSNVEEIDMDDLGLASAIETIQFGEHHCTLIRSDTAKTVTVCLRGATSHNSAEVERAFDDALGVTSLASTGAIVAGGGAVHAHLARILREAALEIGDRVGMALEAYASALESIPRTLAENAGVDPVDALIALRREGGWEHGVSTNGDIINMIEEGVVEPQKVVLKAIECATESAIMVLRIDDVISMKNPQGQGESGFGMGTM